MTRSNALAEASAEAAKNVLLARSALANAARWGTAADVAAARESLRICKVKRLRCDADYLAADLPIPRDRTLLAGDRDPDVKPNAETHRLLEAQHREAVQEFLRSHPRQDEDGEYAWDRATIKAYDALLLSHTDAHVALGCDLLAPCRRPNG